MADTNAAPLGDLIAGILRAEHPGSASVTKLEAMALAEADRLADEISQIRERAYDPLASAQEVTAARSALQDAEFAAGRLAAALPRLAALKAAELAREDQIIRQAEYDATLAERDALAAELRTEYPRLTAALASLLCRINANTARCGAASDRRPTGAGWIGGAEMEVRGPLTGGNFPLAEMIRLPRLGPGPQVWGRGDGKRTRLEA